MSTMVESLASNTVMDLDADNSPLAVTGGVKRRKADGKRLHSPPKRQRLDDPESPEPAESAQSATITTADEAGDEREAELDDQQAEDLADFQIQLNILPSLDALTSSISRFVLRCSDEELLDLSSNRRKAIRRQWDVFQTLLLSTIQYFDPESFQQWRTATERRTLRQAWLLRSLHFLLERDREQLSTMKHDLKALLEDESDGIPWAKQFFTLFDACADPAKDFETVERLRELLKLVKGQALNDQPVLDTAQPAPAQTEEAAPETVDPLPPAEVVAPIGTDIFDEDMFLQRARLAATAALQGPEPERDKEHAESSAAANKSDESSTTKNARREQSQTSLRSTQMATRPAIPAASSQSNTTAKSVQDREEELRQQYLQARAFATSRDQQKRLMTVTTNSSRRTWSTAEEDALMQGLDDVQGPHWAQILARYGENGTISSVLQGRTQVQLKDKARNLKLYFLKNNQSVPGCLRHVTGELRTRAPLHLMREEAERQGSGDERATPDAPSGELDASAGSNDTPHPEQISV